MVTMDGPISLLAITSHLSAHPILSPQSSEVGTKTPPFIKGDSEVHRNHAIYKVLLVGREADSEFLPTTLY